MSIAQGTTHYGYPQVQLNDRPTFADFNPAFEDIDAKLYGLITGTATDEQAIADLGDAVGQLRTDLGGVSDVATAAKNKADANEEAIGLLGTQVSQNTTKLGTKIDSNAIAEPYDTAATYSVGDVVTYSGQRYRCTTAVTVAEPFDATKWTGEDVETVLEQLAQNRSAAGVTLAPITGMSATNVQDGISELNSKLDKGYAEVTGDGVKTNSQLFDALYTLADMSKVSKDTVLFYGRGTIYRIIALSPLIFSIGLVDSTNGETVSQITVNSSGSTMYIGRNGTQVDNSAAVPTNGYSIKLVY